jgi:hypothetical protein
VDGGMDYMRTGFTLPTDYVVVKSTIEEIVSEIEECKVATGKNWL